MVEISVHTISNTANGCMGCMWRLAIKASCSDLDSEIMIWNGRNICAHYLASLYINS